MADATRKPQIPALTDTSAAGLKTWAANVAGALARYLGQSAKTKNALLDQAVTFRDLVDQGFAVIAPDGGSIIPVTNIPDSITPPAPTNLIVTRLAYNMRLTWDMPNYAGHARTEVWRASADNLTIAYKVADVIGQQNIYEDGYVEGQSWFYWIRFVSDTENPGNFNDISGTTDNAEPSDVTGLNYRIEGYAVRLYWNPIIDPDLSDYELRVGADWASGAVIDRTKSTSYLWKFQTKGTYHVFLRARDITGFYSGSSDTVDVVIQPPAIPTVASLIVNDSLRLSWTAVAGTFPIDLYEIRYGADWDTGTVLTQSFTTNFEFRVNWLGVRKFFVAAKDKAGNYGDPREIDVEIVAPIAPPTLRAEVYDNNVELFWTASTATLPIKTYRIYKGATFLTAVQVGEKSGLFTIIAEPVSGNFTYYITAVDVGGNEGPPNSISATVNQPPDFVLYSDQNMDITAGTLSNALIDGDRCVIPYDPTLTWDHSYTDNGWTNDADAIAAGSDYYAEPVLSPGYEEWVIDYGVVLPPTTAAMTATYSIGDGAPVVSYLLSYKLNVGDPWTNLSAGPTQTVPANFRYLKARITATGGDNDFIILTGMNVRLSTKLVKDGGKITALSTDATGTLVNFNINFADIQRGPFFQPWGSTETSVAIDFVDVPNPTSFRVKVFDSTGARVTKDGSWEATGVQGA